MSGATVFFGGYDGRLYALDTITGSPRWVFDEAAWIGSSPTVAKDHGLVFVGLEHELEGERGSVIALNEESGARQWEFKTAAYTHASPLYIAKHSMVVCGSNDGILRAFNARNGEVLWQFQTKGGATYDGQSAFSRGDIKSAPVYDKATDSVAFCAMDGWCYVLRRETGDQIFSMHTDVPDTTIRAGIFGSPLYTDSRILFGGLDKTVYAYDKKTGKHAWQLETNGRVFASPVAIKDSIFIGSNDGMANVQFLKMHQSLSCHKSSTLIQKYYKKKPPSS